MFIFFQKFVYICKANCRFFENYTVLHIKYCFKGLYKYKSMLSVGSKILLRSEYYSVMFDYRS